MSFGTIRANPPVVVILGAGASHVSGDYESTHRPPLTTGLFSTESARKLLRSYSAARAAGRAVEKAMRSNTALAFERALRDLEEDGYEHHRQLALGVAPFLQELLLDYSNELQPDAFRYTALVDELFKLPASTHVCFVSLNYDMLLDNELAAFAPLNTLEDYVGEDRRWSLIKPHGSVAWYIEQTAPFDPTKPPLMTLMKAPIKCEPTGGLDLQLLRRPRPDGFTNRYPALALPVGPKDELIWDPGHRQHLEMVLRSSAEINLLILGYSALDKEILERLKGATTTIRRLTVVNAGASTALGVWQRIEDLELNVIFPDVFEGTYTEWIDDGGLTRWVAEYGQQPDSATAPADVAKALYEAEPEN